MTKTSHKEKILKLARESKECYVKISKYKDYSRFLFRKYAEKRVKQHLYCNNNNNLSVKIPILSEIMFKNRQIEDFVRHINLKEFIDSSPTT